MSVAPLELCKQLYSLSEWNPVGRGWYADVGDTRPSSNALVSVDRYTERCTTVRLCPAYELAFLLHVLESNDTGEGMCLLLTDTTSGVMRWVARSRGCAAEGESPIDAVIRLTIELFRQQMWARNAA